MYEALSYSCLNLYCRLNVTLKSFWKKKLSFCSLLTDTSSVAAVAAWSIAATNGQAFQTLDNIADISPLYSWTNPSFHWVFFQCLRSLIVWKSVRVCFCVCQAALEAMGFCDVCLRMLAYSDVCWRMLCVCQAALEAMGFCDVCLRMLAYSDVCWRMLTYAVCVSGGARGNGLLWRMLTYADVCWRMLTYAVCVSGGARGNGLLWRVSEPIASFETRGLYRMCRHWASIILAVYTKLLCC